MRQNFSPRTRHELAAAAAGFCANPCCRLLTYTYTPDADPPYASFGHAAHMAAASPRGPRADPSLTPEQIKHASNGVWLCPTCATLIDRIPDKYPIETLHQWQAHAVEYAQQLNRTAPRPPIPVDPATVATAAGNFLGRLRSLNAPRKMWSRALAIQQQDERAMLDFIRDLSIALKRPQDPLHGKAPELWQVQNEILRLLTELHATLIDGRTWHLSIEDRLYWPSRDGEKAFYEQDQMLRALVEAEAAVSKWMTSEKYYGNVSMR